MSNNKSNTAVSSIYVEAMYTPVIFLVSILLSTSVILISADKNPLGFFSVVSELKDTLSLSDALAVLIPVVASGPLLMILTLVRTRAKNIEHKHNPHVVFGLFIVGVLLAFFGLLCTVYLGQILEACSSLDLDIENANGDYFLACSNLKESTVKQIGYAYYTTLGLAVLFSFLVNLYEAFCSHMHSMRS